MKLVQTEMTTLCVPIALVAAVLVGTHVHAGSQTTLPEGPNRALVERACGSCHDLAMVAINGRSEGGWNGTIDEMTGYGLRVTPAERAMILEYLKTYLPPR